MIHIIYYFTIIFLGILFFILGGRHFEWSFITISIKERNDIFFTSMKTLKHLFECKLDRGFSNPVYKHNSVKFLLKWLFYITLLSDTIFQLLCT